MVNPSTYIRSLKNKERANNLRKFFKTGKGEYGFGDNFLGLSMPQCRLLVRKFKELDKKSINILLTSTFHEERMIGLLIFVYQFEHGSEKIKKEIFNIYVGQVGKAINNWDLVDVTAPRIVGAYLINKPKDLLYKFATSNNLWKRRVAIISTMFFIQNKLFIDTISLAEILLNDKHDLIHKAVGWMLREVGKKSPEILEKFLRKYYMIMPRTMLRYSIEKLSVSKRQFYLAAKSKNNYAQKKN